LGVNRGEKPNGEIIKILNRLIQRVNLTVTFRADGTFLFGPTAKGFEKALGIMLAIVIKSMEDGSWARLKACSNDQCQWVFYDSSKNNSGRWCLMSACGARSKARTYRKRISANK
jgi:predicted RNA-binding Zn ribbon-like protein